MGFRETLQKWKRYADMSDLAEIARRKFFNNCFDGALTCAGIVSGFFIIFLTHPQGLTSKAVVVTGFATALAIGISGLWGAFLSEEAERKKKLDDLKKEMVILDDDDEEAEDEGIAISGGHSRDPGGGGSPVQAVAGGKKKEKKKSKRGAKKKKKKSIIEEAEDFATIVASLVDGGAPVMGSSLPLIPFFFGALTVAQFVISYCILVALLIYLGLFLGRISGGGGAKYAAHLVAAGAVTLGVSLLLGV
ncbi:MAG: VIT1/CCC1 transporter family protein [Promethearchaeota archaeon]